MIKFKSPQGLQTSLSLMGIVINIFAVDVVRYTKNTEDQRSACAVAKSIWDEATH